MFVSIPSYWSAPLRPPSGPWWANRSWVLHRYADHRNSQSGTSPWGQMSMQPHQSNRRRTTPKTLRLRPHLIMHTWPWRSQPLTQDAAHGSQHKRWPPLYTAPDRISSRTHPDGHPYTHEDFTALTGHTSATHVLHGGIKATHMLFPENSAQGRSPTTTPRNVPTIYQQDFHQI